MEVESFASKEDEVTTMEAFCIVVDERYRIELMEIMKNMSIGESVIYNGILIHRCGNLTYTCKAC